MTSRLWSCFGTRRAPRAGVGDSWRADVCCRQTWCAGGTGLRFDGCTPTTTGKQLRNNLESFTKTHQLCSIYSRCKILTRSKRKESALQRHNSCWVAHYAHRFTTVVHVCLDLTSGNMEMIHKASRPMNDRECNNQHKSKEHCYFCTHHATMQYNVVHTSATLNCNVCVDSVLNRTHSSTVTTFSNKVITYANAPNKHNFISLTTEILQTHIRPAQTFCVNKHNFFFTNEYVSLQTKLLVSQRTRPVQNPRHRHRALDRHILALGPSAMCTSTLWLPSLRA